MNDCPLCLGTGKAPAMRKHTLWSHSFRDGDDRGIETSKRNIVDILEGRFHGSYWIENWCVYYDPIIHSNQIVMRIQAP